MPRFYFHFIVTPLLIFTAALLLIHAQPYDDHELRELLLPEGCPAPCFMGIRPGVTTFDEAMQILETSNWTKDVKLIEDTTGKVSKIEWNWNDGAPSMLNYKIINELQPPYSVTSSNPLVAQMIVETTIPMGDIYLLLGESYDTDSSPPGLTTENVAFVLAQYRQYDFFISSRVYCPVSKARFLNSRTTITWMTPQLISGMTGFGDIYWC